MNITGFSFPTAIKFGAGARKLVADHLKEQGLKRPLIVTDKALAALPVLAEFKTHLNGLDVAVFNGVFGNRLAQAEPQRAHAVLVSKGDGYGVSVRAPRLA